MTAKKTKKMRKLEPPNRSPRQTTTINGNRDLAAIVLLTQVPLKNIRTAKFTTFHLSCPLYAILFRLLATKEWQLQVKRL